MCNRPEMYRVNTASNSTCVIDLQFFRYGSMQSLIGISVSHYSPTIHKELPIAHSICSV